jgi:hypothetical protein
MFIPDLCCNDLPLRREHLVFTVLTVGVHVFWISFSMARVVTPTCHLSDHSPQLLMSTTQTSFLVGVWTTAKSLVSKIRLIFVNGLATYLKIVKET